MRIRDTEAGTDHYVVELVLTPLEAKDLRDVLTTLLSADAGRHEHVASADYQTELVVSVADH